MYVTLTMVALLLAARAAGPAFTHVLEIPGKRRLRTATAVAVQQHLYVGYRRPGALLEIGALVVALVSLVLVWGDGARFWLTLAAVLVLLANVPVFLLWTDRANRRIAGWRADDMPDGWQRTRLRWEASHAIRAVLFTACVALLAGALAAS